MFCLVCDGKLHSRYWFYDKFVISVLQNCYQGSHTYKCYKYYSGYFNLDKLRLLSFCAKNPHAKIIYKKSLLISATDLVTDNFNFYFDEKVCNIFQFFSYIWETTKMVTFQKCMKIVWWEYKIN